jgi:hypothetical protein
MNRRGVLFLISAYDRSPAECLFLRGHICARCARYTASENI